MSGRFRWTIRSLKEKAALPSRRGGFCFASHFRSRLSVLESGDNRSDFREGFELRVD